MLTAAERFWAKVNKNGPIHPILGTRCWLWTAGQNGHGYGHFRLNTTTHTLTHRFSYELATGESLGYGQQLQIDHRCFNQLCVNPAHLRPVTPKQHGENRRGANRNNKSSGVRGVSFFKRDNRWQGYVGHNGKKIYLGLFDTVAEAEAAVIAMRNRLHTHNDVDREAA